MINVDRPNKFLIDVPREQKRRLESDLPPLMEVSSELLNLAIIASLTITIVVMGIFMTLSDIANICREPRSSPKFKGDPNFSVEFSVAIHVFLLGIHGMLLTIIILNTPQIIMRLVSKISLITNYAITQCYLISQPQLQPYAMRFKNEILQAVKRPELSVDLLPIDLAKIVVEYAAPWEFDADSWERVGGVHVDPHPMPARLIKWLDEDDEIDQQEKTTNPGFQVRKNRETFYPPILQPKSIRLNGVNNKPLKSVDFNMGVLEQIAQNPRKGYFPSPPNLDNDNRCYQEIKNKASERVCWIVARKEIVGRNLSEAKQISKFGPLSTALSIATLAHILHLENPQNGFLVDAVQNLKNRYDPKLSVRTCDKTPSSIYTYSIYKRNKVQTTFMERVYTVIYDGLKRDRSEEVGYDFSSGHLADNQMGVAIVRKF